MTREGTLAETRLNLEHVGERAEEVPLWSLSPHLRPTPAEGWKRAEDEVVVVGLGEPSADEAGPRGEARHLMENRDPKAVNSCLKVSWRCV